jgi:hypothetical protein
VLTVLPAVLLVLLATTVLLNPFAATATTSVSHFEYH